MAETVEWTVTAEQAGQTVSAVVRGMTDGRSWSKVKEMITRRRVTIGGDPCMDPARRVKAGERVAVREQPIPKAPGETTDDLVIRHVDADIVVVEKASGLNTVRHPSELAWNDRRRELAPTLQDVTQAVLAERSGIPRARLPRLRIVHRLDKETSGLVVFGRSVEAERSLGAQFKAHTVVRRYLTVVPGRMAAKTFRSWLARDRGDGRRGSGPEGAGKSAITHVTVLESLPHHTVLVCQLETGRTHQIRIHLSEAGHPVAGEEVYDRTPDGRPLPTDPTAPRLALHAMELGFRHPTHGTDMHWQMDPPRDLSAYLDRIRRQPS